MLWGHFLGSLLFYPSIVYSKIPGITGLPDLDAKQNGGGPRWTQIMSSVECCVWEGGCGIPTSQRCSEIFEKYLVDSLNLYIFKKQSTGHKAKHKGVLQTYRPRLYNQDYMLYPANTSTQKPKAAEVQQQDGWLNQEFHPCHFSDQKAAGFDQFLCYKSFTCPLCSLKKYFTYACARMCACTPWHRCASQRTAWGTCVLLLPCGFYGSKSSFQEGQCCLSWQSHLAYPVYSVSNGQSSSLEGCFESSVYWTSCSYLNFQWLLIMCRFPSVSKKNCSSLLKA